MKRPNTDIADALVSTSRIYTEMTGGSKHDGARLYRSAEGPLAEPDSYRTTILTMETDTTFTFEEKQYSARALSVQCPEAWLYWEAYRKSFVLKLGQLQSVGSCLCPDSDMCAGASFSC